MSDVMVVLFQALCEPAFKL